MFSDMIGKPFESGACGPDRYDCWGAVVEAYKRQGINLPEVNISEYRAKEITRLINDEAQTSKWEEIERPEVPCGIVFSGGHVGCYIGKGRFLHVRKDIPVCIERLNSPLWEKKVKGFYRYVG